MASQEHYRLTIEPITYIEANRLTFSEGNVVKYVTRHRRKDGARDIKKAIDYCQRILASEYGEQSVITYNDSE